MHEQPASPSPLPPASMSFEFKNGIPSAHSAGLLKFGLEALPGVQRMGFIGDREIQVMIGEETAVVERMWEVIAGAGFSADEVTLNGGLLCELVESEEATPESSQIVPAEVAA